MFARPFDGFCIGDAISVGIWTPVLVFSWLWFEGWQLYWGVATSLGFAVALIFIAGSATYYPREIGLEARDRLGFAVLVSLVVLALPAYRQAAVVFLPFLAGYIAYWLPARRALAIILGGGLAPLLLAWLVDPVNVILYAFSAVVWPMFVFTVVQIDIQSERSTDLAHELDLTRQREAIARDIHDILGHSLTVMALKAEVAKMLIEKDPAQATEEVEAIAELARTSLAEARSTVTRMHSPSLSGELAAARRAFETAGIAAQLPEVPPEAGENEALFSWALRESTTNIVRHSEATQASVSITPHRLTISDNGVGFVPEQAPAGGLEGIASRASASGAQLAITSAPGRGTTIEISDAQSLNTGGDN